MFKRALTILVLVFLPPTAALVLAAAVGWLHFELSLGGVGLILGIYGGWVAAVAGLTEIAGFLRNQETLRPWPGVLYQAPRPMADFVGRQDEIKRLVRALKPGAKAVVIGVVGMGGLGKTELVKVAACQVARRFRDGVLWADCDQQTPTEIADGWAVVYGEAQLPGDDLPAKAAAWRGLVSGKEALLIFDNVQPVQEIEPLFPPQGRSMVLITTRHADHPALRGANRLRLDQFTRAEASELAKRVLGQHAAHQQAAEVAHLFDLLGYLPLAVGVALQLAQQCGWALAYLNGKLEAAGAVKVLDSAENLRKSLEATFETSWDNLPNALKWTFRALALFNAGPSFSTLALAETLNMEESQVRARLRRLVGRSLLAEVGEDRWSLHSLMREFASTRQPVDEATQMRMARHYEEVARIAQNLYLQGGENVLRGLKLFDREWPHIQAGQAWSASHAATSKEAARLCSDYPDAATYCLNLRLSPHGRIAWRKAAARAVRQLEDRKAEGYHLGNLGIAYADLGEARQAIELHEQALAIFCEIGDRRGEGYTLGNLGRVYTMQGYAQRAIELYERALVIHREIGNKHGEGYTLGNLGNAYRQLGKMQQAVECYQQALVIAREIGNRRGEGACLGNLGLVYAASGDARRAIEFYEQALEISREIGDRHNEGNILENMGSLAQQQGDLAHAREVWIEALRLYEATENSRAGRVRGWLAGLEEQVGKNCE